MKKDIRPLPEPGPQQVAVAMRYNWPGAVDHTGSRDTMQVRERPVETVRRRLKELGLSQAKMARALRVTPKHVSYVLTERAACSFQFLAEMLDYVGMELVAVSDLIEWREREGHWFHGERCQYCGVNTYDAMLYAPGPCPKSRILPKEK